MANYKLSLKNYIAYGMGDLFGGGAFTLIASLFILFLTNIVGISPVMAGTLFGLGRLGIGLIDPIVGNFSDNIRTKYGRRRVFFLYGMLPIILTFPLMWCSPIIVGKNGVTEFMAFLYYLGMYLLFDIVYCFVITPYAALIADMTRDYKERVRLSAFRMGFSQFASVLATSIAPLLLGSFNYSRNGYLVMSIIFAIFFACIWIFVFWGTFELPIPEDKNEFKPNQSKIDNALLFLKELLSTLKNKSFRAQLSMFLLDAAALDMLMIITPILVKDDLMRSDLVPYVSSMWLIQLLVLPFYVHLANKYNKAFTYRVGAMIWILGILSLFLLTKHSVSVFLIICCFGLIGLGLSSCYMIPQSMLSFVVEVDVLISTKSRPGLYAGAMSFCRKFSQAIIILPGIGYLMSMSGYQKGGVIQSPETMFTLKILFILIPVALVIIAFINSYKFCLTPTNFKLMKQEIDRLRDGGKEYPSIEVQQVCEKITGQQYSKLYLAWSK